MKPANLKARNLSVLLVVVILIITSCKNKFIPENLAGTYTGKERILLRYDRGGQYIYRDTFVSVSLIIDSTGNITGMVGEASFDSCSVKPNRGWIEQQLGIRTDFVITGMLRGNTFDKDTMENKEISIPFNIFDNELKGSLLLTSNGQDFPMISVLKLKKAKE